MFNPEPEFVYTIVCENSYGERFYDFSGTRVSEVLHKARQIARKGRLNERPIARVFVELER